MWQVTQDLCNWPLELTVVTAVGKLVSEVFPKSPGYHGQLEGVLLKARWECLLVWTYVGYPEGCRGLGIQLSAAPSATLSFVLWCLQWKFLRNVRWADAPPRQSFSLLIPSVASCFLSGLVFLAYRALVWSLMLRGCSSLSYRGSGKLTLAACVWAGDCRWNQTAKWPSDNFVTYLVDMLCMTNTIPLPLFQSWPVLYWQADHFLSKPVSSLVSLWGFSTWIFATGGKQMTFFCVQGLRDTERFLREQCCMGWDENFRRTPIPFCRNLGIA